MTGADIPAALVPRQGLNGLLVIDKPGGRSSREVVNRVQKWFPRKTKIGHSGTLDPLATGVLVVCIGAATRLADFVQAMGKSYSSRFRLGATSTTDDADGEIRLGAVALPPTRSEVEAALIAFVGWIEQLPPTVSALKVDGKRSHELARRGMDVPLAARAVRIDAIRVLAYEWPFLDVEVDCGKGTYIRSIARDLGASLGCGGIVQTLRRTGVGPFAAEHGIGLEATPREARAKMLPMTAALPGMPRVPIAPESERRFRTGQAIPTPIGTDESPVGDRVAIVDGTGELIGIAIRASGNRLQPAIVIPR